MKLIEQILNVVYNVGIFLYSYDYGNTISYLKFFSILISPLLLYGIIYSVIKTRKIFGAIKPAARPAAKIPEDKNKNLEEWDKITAKSASEDENERKFAIIAADTLIEKILSLAGYEGENLGERLKKIEPSDLDSLNNLWEAHKVRNRIAHEANYRLSKEDAKSALKNFESALRELEFI